MKLERARSIFMDSISASAFGSSQERDWGPATNSAFKFLTPIAFHFGAFEVNPLVAHLAKLLGPAGGVVASKVAAVLLALGVQKRLWIVNLFYTGVVCWNILVLLALARHLR